MDRSRRAGHVTRGHGVIKRLAADLLAPFRSTVTHTRREGQIKVKPGVLAKSLKVRFAKVTAAATVHVPSCISRVSTILSHLRDTLGTANIAE